MEPLQPTPWGGGEGDGRTVLDPAYVNSQFELSCCRMTDAVHHAETHGTWSDPRIDEDGGGVDYYKRSFVRGQATVQLILLPHLSEKQTLQYYRLMLRYVEWHLNAGLPVPDGIQLALLRDLVHELHQAVHGPEPGAAAAGAGCSPPGGEG